MRRSGAVAALLAVTCVTGAAVAGGPGPELAEGAGDGPLVEGCTAGEAVLAFEDWLAIADLEAEVYSLEARLEEDREPPVAVWAVMARAPWGQRYEAEITGEGCCAMGVRLAEAPRHP